MAQLEKKSINFLIALTRIISTMQMYSPTHPAVNKGIELAFKQLQDLLQESSCITIGKGEGVLVIQDVPLQDRHPTAEKFLELLEARNIVSISFERGVQPEELHALVKLVSTRPDRVLVDGQIAPQFLAPLKKLRLNEARYQLVAEGEEYVPSQAKKSEPEVKGLSLEDVKSLFDKLFTEEISGKSGQSGFMALNASFNQMISHLKGLDPDESKSLAWNFFQKALDALVAGTDFSNFRDGLLSTVTMMNPMIQQLLFGRTITETEEVLALLKNFSLDRKVALLTKELKGSKGEQGFREALASLLQTRGEIVTLAEELARRLGGQDNPEMLDQLFKLVQELEKGAQLVVRTRGCAYVLDPSKAYQDAYRKTLRKEGFDVMVIPDGKEALKAIEKTPPDLLIMEAKLPGASGVEILGMLDRKRMHVPVILCTAMAGIQNSFEVQMYPKLKFLKKPLRTNHFLAAVNSLAPIKRERKQKEQARQEQLKKPEVVAELVRAHEIQQNLLPDQIPSLPGYDIGAYYNSCREVGGDYYDFIPLDDTHLGIIIADVSGKGITGAMVMVMVRSVLRMTAPHFLSPKEVFLRANPLITRDIVSGMFCTAYYLVLDIPNHTITACSAGHNPAVLWDSSTGTASFTTPGGMPLGILDSSMFEQSLTEEQYMLKNGDRFTLYTDGVPEAMSPTEEEFGEQRMLQSMSRHAPQTSSMFLRGLLTALAEHQGNAPQHDDITVVTFQYRV